MITRKTRLVLFREKTEKLITGTPEIIIKQIKENKAPGLAIRITAQGGSGVAGSSEQGTETRTSTVQLQHEKLT